MTKILVTLSFRKFVDSSLLQIRISSKPELDSIILLEPRVDDSLKLYSHLWLQQCRSSQIGTRIRESLRERWVTYSAANKQNFICDRMLLQRIAICSAKVHVSKGRQYAPIYSSAAETGFIIGMFSPRETSIELPESRLREDGYFIIEDIVGHPDKCQRYKIITF